MSLQQCSLGAGEAKRPSRGILSGRRRPCLEPAECRWQRGTALGALLPLLPRGNLISTHSPVWRVENRPKMAAPGRLFLFPLRLPLLPHGRGGRPGLTASPPNHNVALASYPRPPPLAPPIGGGAERAPHAGPAPRGPRAPPHGRAPARPSRPSGRGPSGALAPLRPDPPGVRNSASRGSLEVLGGCAVFPGSGDGGKTLAAATRWDLAGRGHSGVTCTPRCEAGGAASGVKCRPGFPPHPQPSLKTSLKMSCGQSR